MTISRWTAYAAMCDAWAPDGPCNVRGPVSRENGAHALRLALEAGWRRVEEHEAHRFPAGALHVCPDHAAGWA